MGITPSYLSQQAQTVRRIFRLFVSAFRVVPTAQRLWVSSYSISVSLSYVGDSIGLILSISLLRHLSVGVSRYPCSSFLLVHLPDQDRAVTPPHRWHYLACYSVPSGQSGVYGPMRACIPKAHTGVVFGGAILFWVLVLALRH